MKYDQQQKKLKPEIKSVGDAWMEHVQKHHNADAVTPSYLKYSDKKIKPQEAKKTVSKLKQSALKEKAIQPQCLNKEMDKNINTPSR